MLIERMDKKLDIAQTRKLSKKWGDGGDCYDKTPKKMRRKQKI